MSRIFPRDSQRAKVYAWEHLAYPKLWAEESLHSREVVALVNRVHEDVIDAGGHAAFSPEVRFTNRSGRACASWGKLTFTRGKTSRILVLHEIAHSLTWHPREYRTARAKLDAAQAAGSATTFLTGEQQHILRTGCNQGHGPRYVACFIALAERYAGADAAEAATLAAGFSVAGWGAWKSDRAWSEQRGGFVEIKTRGRVTKRARVAIDPVALQFWRQLLSLPVFVV